MDGTALISGICKDFWNGFKHAKILIANGNENRNVLDLATPATFQVNIIYVNTGIVPGKRTSTPGFDMLISLFIQVADGSRGYFRSL